MQAGWVVIEQCFCDIAFKITYKSNFFFRNQLSEYTHSLLQTKASVCVCRLWTPALQKRLPDNSRGEICLWVSNIMQYLEKIYSISSDFISLVQVLRQCLRCVSFNWWIIHRNFNTVFMFIMWCVWQWNLEMQTQLWMFSPI